MASRNFCSSCGDGLVPGAAFCGNCGTGVPSSVHAPAAQQAPSARPLDKKGSPGSLNHIEGLGIKLLIFLAICGLVSLALFHLGSSPGSSSSAPAAEQQPGSVHPVEAPDPCGTDQACIDKRGQAEQDREWNDEQDRKSDQQQRYWSKRKDAEGECANADDLTKCMNAHGVY